MAQGNELERLEGFVTKILTEYNELREEKKQLLDELHEKEDRIATLQKELASAQMERSDVGSRVQGLIQQSEAWESSLDEDDDNRQKTVLQESRMQRNLFSVGPNDDSHTQE